MRALVLKGRAKIKATDEKGKTARDYALSRKNEKVVSFLDNPKQPEPEPEEEGEEEEDDKPKTRVFKASQQVGISAETKKQEGAYLAKLVAATSM